MAMSFSSTLSHHSFTSLSPFIQTPKRISLLKHSIKATTTDEPEKDKKVSQTTNSEVPKTQSVATKRPLKPVYSMKKGQIVRVDKEKYLNSINYLSVGHPPYYKGLDYIYEDRGEVLDLRIFETGEYALIAWVGVPTSPAWLPTDMLIKSDKLDYERM
ncbi:NAD(P)H-quinone oxidoreductase subunit O protein [Thalictrum thalictroides]|uniref:NAD(P)H-quinone oxidoreductase subunit O protein n=1 Tax=Thalictrum thalictroides TaxID=46969 RepID=A0A7J6VRY6_THATH|nr:NAD(P)H-quinone oxidoreductase subunit O protein [Thalictrum thalictroides]